MSSNIVSIKKLTHFYNYCGLQKLKLLKFRFAYVFK